MASTPRSQAPDVSFPADASHHNKLKAEITGFRSKNTAKIHLKCSSLWPAAIRWVAFFVVCNDLKVWFFSCLHLGVITCSIFSSSTSDHGWVLWLQPFSVSGSSSRWAGVVPQSKLLTCKWTGLCSVHWASGLLLKGYRLHSAGLNCFKAGIGKFQTYILMSSKHWRCWDETAWLKLISSQNNLVNNMVKIICAKE